MNRGILSRVLPDGVNACQPPLCLCFPGSLIFMHVSPGISIIWNLREVCTSERNLCIDRCVDGRGGFIIDVPSPLCHPDLRLFTSITHHLVTSWSLEIITLNRTKRFLLFCCCWGKRCYKYLM